MKEDAAHSRFGGRPYLQCLKSLENAFPALKPFLENISKENDHGREDWCRAGIIRGSNSEYRGDVTA